MSLHREIFQILLKDIKTTQMVNFTSCKHTVQCYFQRFQLIPLYKKIGFTEINDNFFRFANFKQRWLSSHQLDNLGMYIIKERLVPKILMPCLSTSVAAISSYRSCNLSHYFLVVRINLSAAGTHSWQLLSKGLYKSNSPFNFNQANRC